MSRCVVHKESLPAQVGIKRRRTTVEGQPATPSSPPPPSSSVAADVDEDADRRPPSEIGGTDDVHRTDAEKAVDEGNRARARASSSEESESDDEDDVAELERERRRIEQMRSEKQRTREERVGTAAARTTDIGGGNSGSNCGGGGGVSSYNHDVLFRRREWRERGVVAATGKEKREPKKAKWEAVQNNAQNTAAFQHFMKKHFK
ncbi:hypothetical protein DQ04_06271010 [Trypanosoma grayi]|uniref:hypothetical protein n=1 Tax=Trypanosoma grayi TaxID=71804 RepID=UPI0004F45046|nr:hypothetical protein DQ04_06271010 [Trypanosoma grayi]KEG08872.1 hypothetical protein DQ04_06271010 [Trypanosoma grayi]